MDAGRPCPAEEVDVVIFRLGAGLFFGAVADTKIYPIVAALGDGYLRRHVLRLLFLLQRLDVDELEQLHAVQPALRRLQGASPEQIARLVAQLPLDDAVVDRLVAGDIDGSEMSQSAGIGRER